MKKEPYPEAKTLRELVQWAGLTYQEMAEKTGIPRVTISKLATGKQRPYVHQILDIARAVNVPLSVVLRAMDFDLSGIPSETGGTPLGATGSPGVLLENNSELDTELLNALLILVSHLQTKTSQHNN